MEETKDKEESKPENTVAVVLYQAIEPGGRREHGESKHAVLILGDRRVLRGARRRSVALGAGILSIASMQ